MPTLRQLLDGAKEVFDATVESHNEMVTVRSGFKGHVRASYTPPRFSPKELEATMSLNMVQALHIDATKNFYMNEVAIMGERLHQEYQRGYSDGFQAASEKQKEMKPRQTPPPFIQSNREVDFEE